MNDKEKLFHQIVETVARCTSYGLEDGRQSITEQDILGKCRRENVTMARSIAIGILTIVGFSVSTCSMLMNRSPPAIRNMINMDRQLQETSRVYRIAYRQARNQIRSQAKEEDDEKKDD